MALFDVGETLIHEGKPFSGVETGLAAIAAMETVEGRPLVMGIVSDYHMPSPPRTEEKIASLEERYRTEVLGPSRLTGFFEPFDSRVTISSRAGVVKPDRKIFEVAVARSATGAQLTQCLFVTENVTHLRECKRHGITPVRFGQVTGELAGFDDWADGPGVLAALIAPGHPGNQVAAVAATLAARHGLAGFKKTAAAGQRLRGQATQLLQLKDPALGPLDGIHVENPIEVSVELGSDGRVVNVDVPTPGAEELADKVNFVRTLFKSGRVALPGHQGAPFGVTHSVTRDSEGRSRLVWRRSSGR